jgi:hypothetical protein
MNPIWAAAVEVERIVRAARFPFCFIGGIAVQRWGQPRMTADIDLTVITGFGDEERYVDVLLASLGGRLADARSFALRHRTLLLIASNGVHVDISLGAMPFEERSVERASLFAISDHDSITTCSAEDLIVPAPDTCSTVLLYGQKFDLNHYLTRRPDAPVHTIDDIIAFNNANPTVALKYGQALFLAAAALDTAPGSADTQRLIADRAKDLQLTRGGLDAVLNGPDGIAGTADDFDAILFPQNRGAGAPAKAGYPSVAVPAGFTTPIAPVVNPTPFGIAFTGRAYSEPRLIALAFAFEQATHHRTAPASAPPLPTDTVTRHHHHDDDHGHGHHGD